MISDAQNLDFPPVSVAADERTTAGDSEFSNKCMDQLKTMSGLGKLTLKSSSLTRSDQWGRIFRVDFLIQDDDGRGVNRMICWMQKDGRLATSFAIGQDVPTLRDPN